MPSKNGMRVLSLHYDEAMIMLRDLNNKILFIEIHKQAKESQRSRCLKVFVGKGDVDGMRTDGRGTYVFSMTIRKESSRERQVRKKLRLIALEQERIVREAACRANGHFGNSRP